MSKKFSKFRGSKLFIRQLINIIWNIKLTWNYWYTEKFINFLFITSIDSKLKFFEPFAC